MSRTRSAPPGLSRQRGRKEVLVILSGLLFVPAWTASSETTSEASCAQLAPAQVARADEAQRPPTEREIELLIRALEPVELAAGQGRTTRAVTEGSQLSQERMALLMSDLTALLAELHARETLGRLRRAPGITSALRTRTAKALEGVGHCVRARFTERGGERAFAESARLVERHRAALERALLESHRSGP